MKTIEVEDDVYEHILRKSKFIGEGATSILRRELGMEKAGADASPQDAALSAYLQTPAFLLTTTATDRYLAVLGHAHSQDKEKFGVLFTLPGGNKRVYFAKSQKEILDSGTSTHPRQIPGTKFWALTNMDTKQKKERLSVALRALGYGTGVVAEALKSLD